VWGRRDVPSGVLMRGRCPLLRRSAGARVCWRSAMSTRTGMHRRCVHLHRLRFDDEQRLQQHRRLSVRRGRGRPALRFRAVHTRRDLVLQGVLQRRHLRDGHRCGRVRQRRSSVCGLPPRRQLHRRRVQQLGVSERVLHRDDVQHAVRGDLRCIRTCLHRMRPDLGRRLLRPGGLHMRRPDRLLQRPEVRRRPLRVRRDVMFRVLRRDGLAERPATDARRPEPARATEGRLAVPASDAFRGAALAIPRPARVAAARPECAPRCPSPLAQHPGRLARHAIQRWRTAARLRARANVAAARRARAATARARRWAAGPTRRAKTLTTLRQKRVTRPREAPPGSGATEPVVWAPFGQPSQVSTAPVARATPPDTKSTVASVARDFPES